MIIYYVCPLFVKVIYKVKIAYLPDLSVDISVKYGTPASPFFFRDTEIPGRPKTSDCKTERPFVTQFRVVSSSIMRSLQCAACGNRGCACVRVCASWEACWPAPTEPAARAQTLAIPPHANVAPDSSTTHYLLYTPHTCVCVRCMRVSTTMHQ